MHLISHRAIRFGCGLCLLSFRTQNRFANVADRIETYPFEVSCFCALLDKLIGVKNVLQRLNLDYLMSASRSDSRPDSALIMTIYCASCCAQGVLFAA